MKIDEVALHTVLRAYGKVPRVPREKNIAEKADASEPEASHPATIQGDLAGILYDQQGQLTLSPDKRRALIDFFE